MYAYLELVYICLLIVCPCTRALCVHACAHVGLRGQLTGTGSLLLQCGSQGWNSDSPPWWPVLFTHRTISDGTRICSLKTSTRAAFLGNLRVLSFTSLMGKLLSVETDWKCFRPEVSIPTFQLSHSSERVWKAS